MPATFHDLVCTGRANSQILQQTQIQAFQALQSEVDVKHCDQAPTVMGMLQHVMDV